MNAPTEKFLAPKQLASEIREIHGIIVGVGYVRAMIRSGVSPRLGYNVRLSDLIRWWLDNPDFSPRANEKKRERSEARGKKRISAGK